MNRLWFKGVNPTVDMVLVIGKTIEDAEILMVKRATEPFLGRFALPGGFIDSHSQRGDVFIPSETPMDAALREVLEETSVDYTGKLYSVGFFEGGGRDPRDSDQSWTRSHAFVAYLNEKPESKPQDGEVTECRWVKLIDVLEGNIDVAFDHGKIIKTAMPAIRMAQMSPDIIPAVKLDR